MEAVILKIILCSSLLVAVYYLFLQKEKMFRFNRFYLLLALIFSYTIPFVKINLPAVSEKKSQLIFEEITAQQLIQKTNQASDFNWTNLILIIYIFVSIVLIIKSLMSIRKIITLEGTDINHQGQKVKLIEKDLPPFSFWNKIYLNKRHFKDQIDNRIFLHEKTHLIQKHSLDLIFIEVLQAISWFNPAIYFYKKAITDNHEFLADAFIIEKDFNIKDYQNLILAEVLNAQNLSLINQFNFNNTKKRFIMMNTKRSKLEKFKKLFAVSAFAGLSILFVQKVYASETKSTVKSGISGIITKESVKLDTIPNKQSSQANVKIKGKKNVPPPPPPPVEMKENELPIPPPPPPARNFTNAEFPEGLNGLRKGIAEAFDSSFLGKGEKGTIKTTLYVTINKYGEAVEIKPDGSNQKFNEEAVKAFKTATKGKTWKPATEEWQPTATVFQFPITMNFQ